MISTKTMQYKLPKESLMLVQEPQIRLFEDDFKVSLKKEFIGILYDRYNKKMLNRGLFHWLI